MWFAELVHEPAREIQYCTAHGHLSHTCADVVNFRCCAGDIEMSHTARTTASPPIIRYASPQRSESFLMRAGRKLRGSSGDDASHGSGWEKSLGIAGRGRSESHGDYSMVSTASAERTSSADHTDAAAGTGTRPPAPTATTASSPSLTGKKKSLAVLAADVAEFLNDQL